MNKDAHEVIADGMLNYKYKTIDNVDNENNVEEELILCSRK